MSKPWEQQPGEPDRWYSRFHDLYLLAGPERSLDDAFRTYKAKQPGDGKPERSRAPGAWYVASTKWKWAERARAWDNDERRRIRAQHFKFVMETQRKHWIVLQAAFNKFIKGFQNVSAENLTFPQSVSLLGQLINLERLVMGMPLTIGQVRSRFGKDGDEPTDVEQAAMAGAAEAQAPITTEEFAQVLAIMGRHGALHDDTERDATPESRSAG